MGGCLSKGEKKREAGGTYATTEEAHVKAPAESEEASSKAKDQVDEEPSAIGTTPVEIEEVPVEIEEAAGKTETAPAAAEVQDAAAEIGEVSPAKTVREASLEMEESPAEIEETPAKEGESSDKTAQAPSKEEEEEDPSNETEEAPADIVDLEAPIRSEETHVNTIKITLEAVNPVPTNDSSGAGNQNGTPNASKPVVFVLGASGFVGSATVKSLSEEYGDRVEIRAGVRNPEGADKLHGLPGVTLVQASMADKDNLVAVLDGVSALFIVVARAENRVELTSISADAAREAGVGHLVVVSLPVAGAEGTILGNQFGEIEANIKGLGIPYTILRLPYFMENFFTYASTVKENDEFHMAVPADTTFTVVDTNDAGKAAAAVLVDPSKHAEKIYHIVSARVTNHEIATILSSLLDKEVCFVQAELEAAKQFMFSIGLAEWEVDGVIGMLKLMEDDTPSMNLENIGDFKEITGKDPASVKDFFTRHLAVFQ